MGSDECLLHSHICEFVDNRQKLGCNLVGKISDLLVTPRVSIAHAVDSHNPVTLSLRKLLSSKK
jgi:hypothetical protein